MTTDNSLITFKAISNFTTCLSEVFGIASKPLKLYAHLISKTTIAHDIPIQKHITAFRDFCIPNREAIMSKNYEKFDPKNITYSSRVYIDMHEILKASDTDTTDVIWKHILTISALVDPTGKAREILQESVKQGGGNATEADFLTDIIGKVEEHVKPDANPMEAVSSIMQSGIFTELVGGMGNGLQNGSLDLNKLMGTVQKMVTTLNEQTGGSCDSGGATGDINGMMSGMMASLNAGAGAGAGTSAGAPPDLSAVMGMMGPMLGALGGAPGGGALPSSGNSIEDRIESHVNQAKKNGTLASSSTITELD